MKKDTMVSAAQDHSAWFRESQLTRAKHQEVAYNLASPVLVSSGSSGDNISRKPWRSVIITNFGPHTAFFPPLRPVEPMRRSPENFTLDQE